MQNTKNKTKAKAVQSIDELMKNTTPSQTLIAAAIEREQKEESERKIREIQRELQSIEGNIQNGVRILRNARTVEKKAKEHLQKMLDAQKQYMQDADYKAYYEAVSKVVNSELGYDIDRIVSKHVK